MITLLYSILPNTRICQLMNRFCSGIIMLLYSLGGLVFVTMLYILVAAFKLLEF